MTKSFDRDMDFSRGRFDSKEKDGQLKALAIIANDLGLEASALRIESLVENRPAVFYDMPDGTVRSACSLNSNCWREALAKTVAMEAISKAKSI